jgi:hypothetical protein
MRLRERFGLTFSLPTGGVLVALLALALAGQAVAQEQFFTQSGGRGLQNAKTNARLSKMETDVGTLNTEMAKVQPHAKAELGVCAGEGEKLRYTGTNWVCESETDPTVMDFAKKPLPTCGGGSMLGVTGGTLGCINTTFVTAESDPTVQEFAKKPINNCAVNEVLTVQNGALKCLIDQRGISNETDPTVHDFAKTSSALPNCALNELVTMRGGNLFCQADVAGLTVETDPKTASFARNDIAGYTLSACSAGTVLKAVNNAGGQVILECVPVSTSLSETIALGDLSDVDTTGAVNGKILMRVAGVWQPADETDPNVSSWAKAALPNCGAGQVLSGNGTNLSCVADTGGGVTPTLAILTDVNLAGLVDGQFLRYNNASSRWVPGTVQSFAQSILPTCAAGQVLSGDGTNLSCVADAGGSASPVNLVDLLDVRSAPGVSLPVSTGDFLRWNGSKWIATPDRVQGTLTSGNWCYYNGTNVTCDRGPPQQCGAGDVMSWNAAGSAFGCVSSTTALGLGTMSTQNANSVAITGGTMNGVVIGGTNPVGASFTTIAATSGVITGNLQVQGQLFVSGTQTFQGVTFSNGGVSATGTVTATAFNGNGANVTNVQAANVVAAGVAGSVQFKAATNEVSGTNLLVWDNANQNLAVSGTLQVAGSVAGSCGPGDYGKLRMVDVGGGDWRMQFCRP